MMNNAEFIANENEPYFLNCTVTGRPKPNVSWMKVSNSFGTAFLIFIYVIIYLSIYGENGVGLVGEENSRI